MENQNLNQQPVESQIPQPQVPTQPEQPVISPQQPKTNWPVLILVVVLAVVSYAGVAYWQNMWPFVEDEVVEVFPSITPKSTPDATAGWETYRSDGLEFKYPNNWVLNKENNRIIISSVETIQKEEERIRICNDNDPNTNCNSSGIGFDIIFKLGSSEVSINYGTVSFGDNLFTKYEAMGLFGEEHYKIDYNNITFDFGVYTTTGASNIEQILSTLKLTN